MTTLYALSADIKLLEHHLSDDELTDEQRQALIDEWQEAQFQAEGKIDDYAALIRSVEMRAQQRLDEAKRIREEAIRIEAIAAPDLKLAEKLKERLTQYFQTHELTVFNSPRFCIKLKEKGGKRPVIFEGQIEDLTERFLRIVPEKKELDKDEMYKALSAGEEIPGAKLAERPKVIEIK
jgi:hypothetical protein